MFIYLFSRTFSLRSKYIHKYIFTKENICIFSMETKSSFQFRFNIVSIHKPCPARAFNISTVLHCRTANLHTHYEQLRCESASLSRPHIILFNGDIQWLESRVYFVPHITSSIKNDLFETINFANFKWYENVTVKKVRNEITNQIFSFLCSGPWTSPTITVDNHLS